MGILFPKLTARQWGAVFATAVFGALVGGCYGAIHDQISYSISPEYFTRMKFQQFADADFGWPPRAFASEIGFLATWWVGLIAGWILGRVGYGYSTDKDATRRVLKAFAILVGITAFSGLVGALTGVYQTRGEGLEAWREWREALYLSHVREFAIVAYLHAAGYIGAVLGMLIALVFLIVNKPKIQ